MGVLLSFSNAIDKVNEKLGAICNWLVLLSCLVSGGNAMVRYAYDTSSNAWLEVQWYMLGTLVFLLPTCAILAWLSWPFFMQSYNVFEHSSNAGGLLRWPIKLVLPVGFVLVALQGLSELIKRVAFLNGYPVESLEAHYERPTQ